MTSFATLQSLPTKDLPGATNTYIYPSPSLSPVTTFRNTMEPAEIHRRSSVMSLMTSTNPPPSPLDALVLALEATAEEMQGRLFQEQSFHSELPALSEHDDDDEDPNATVPSSPTFFLKSGAAPSLHQLPSLLLPEAAVYSGLPLPASSMNENRSPLLMAPSHLPSNTVSTPLPSNLTPSTHPDYADGQRKMSVSSHGSADSGFSTNSSEERHKTFACSVGSCEKKFYQVAHLRIHERCHTGTRPFVCRFDGCERSFTQLGNLKTHERKHTGERPFKCQHSGCDKTFTQLGNLKTHERIHDEVKPFMCRLPGCGKTFSQLGNLKTHTAKMHPDATISDEELAIKTVLGPSRTGNAQPDSAARMSQGKEREPSQVVAHFNPYQRRPIRPQRSERAGLLKDILAMIHHQEQQAQRTSSEGEASETMEE